MGRTVPTAWLTRAGEASVALERAKLNTVPGLEVQVMTLLVGCVCLFEAIKESGCGKCSRLGVAVLDPALDPDDVITGRWQPLNNTRKSQCVTSVYFTSVAQNS